MLKTIILPRQARDKHRGTHSERRVAFSLGVEVDLEAVERYRVPQAVLDALRDATSGLVAGIAGVREPPRIINTIVYPDGAAVHMMNSSVGYSYFSEGTPPLTSKACALGETMEVKSGTGCGSACRWSQCASSTNGGRWRWEMSATTARARTAATETAAANCRTMQQCFRVHSTYYI